MQYILPLIILFCSIKASAQLPDLIPYRKGSLWGYADSTGKIVIEPQFDEAGFFVDELTPVSMHGLVFYINKTGKIFPAPTPENVDLLKSFDRYELISRNNNEYYIVANEKSTRPDSILLNSLYTIEGKQIIPPMYNMSYPVEILNDYFIMNDSRNPGRLVFSKSGELIMQSGFFKKLNDSTFIASGNKGTILFSGNKLIDLGAILPGSRSYYHHGGLYYDVIPWGKGRYFVSSDNRALRNREGILIDHKGNQLTKLVKMDTELDSGKFIAYERSADVNEEKVYYLFNEDGEKLRAYDNIKGNLADVFMNRYLKFTDFQNASFSGVIDTSGRQVLEQKYYEIFYWKDNLFFVKLNPGRFEKVFVVSENDSIIRQLEYTYVAKLPFNNNYIAYIEADNVFILNNSLNRISNGFSRYLFSLKNGYHVVGSKEPGLALADSTGAVKSEFNYMDIQFLESYGFLNGDYFLGYLIRNNRSLSTVLDAEGKERIPISNYPYLHNLSIMLDRITPFENRIAIHEHSKRNKNNHVLVDRDFNFINRIDADQIQRSREGLALAKKSGKRNYGYIDSSGRWVYKPKFKSASNFILGKALVEPKNWFKKPHIIINPLLKREQDVTIIKQYANGSVLVLDNNVSSAIEKGKNSWGKLYYKLKEGVTYYSIESREQAVSNSYGLRDSSGVYIVPIGKYSFIIPVSIYCEENICPPDGIFSVGTQQYGENMSKFKHLGFIDYYGREYFED
jgi:hypothetical protein